MTVVLAQRHPRAWWIRRLYRLPWALPLLALWILIAVRGHWYLSFLPDVTGYHWMVPLAALLSALWLGSLFDAADEQPLLSPCEVHIGDEALVLGGERLSWPEVTAVAVVRGRHPRLAMDTRRGPRALYSPAEVELLERVGSAIRARLATD